MCCASKIACGSLSTLQWIISPYYDTKGSQAEEFSAGWQSQSLKQGSGKKQFAVFYLDRLRLGHLMDNMLLESVNL